MRSRQGEGGGGGAGCCEEVALSSCSSQNVRLQMPFEKANLQTNKSSHLFPKRVSVHCVHVSWMGLRPGWAPRSLGCRAEQAKNGKAGSIERGSSVEVCVLLLLLLLYNAIVNKQSYAKPAEKREEESAGWATQHQRAQAQSLFKSSEDAARKRSERCECGCCCRWRKTKARSTRQRRLETVPRG